MGKNSTTDNAIYTSMYSASKGMFSVLKFQVNECSTGYLSPYTKPVYTQPEEKRVFYASIEINLPCVRGTRSLNNSRHDSVLCTCLLFLPAIWSLDYDKRGGEKADDVAKYLRRYTCIYMCRTFYMLNVILRMGTLRSWVLWDGQTHVPAIVYSG